MFPSIRLQLISLATALSLAISVTSLQAQDAAASKDTVRAEVGKPLQEAQKLLGAKNFKDAMAKINEADAIPNKTSYENYIIEQMRSAAAANSGDTDAVVKASESLLASGRLSPADALKRIEAVAGTLFRAKEYAKAAAWAGRYQKEGGSSPAINTLRINSLYLSNDFSGAAKEQLAEIRAVEKSGGAPSEDQLKLLASCNLKMNDTNGYVGTLERLVTHYPKKDYWNDLTSRIEKKAGFSQRFVLDVYRLRYATGGVSSAGDIMEMSQIALQAGFPSEAKKVVEQGYTAGTLGGGADADRHKRLREMVSKQMADDQKSLKRNEVDAAKAKDGTGLINLGYEYVSSGQADKGVSLIEQGLQKENFSRPDETKLHAAVAYILAGQKSKATPILKMVGGTEGAADLARLWILVANK